MIFLILLLSILSLPVSAQTIDWCGQTLPLQSDPNTSLLWRLRCTVQILDHERAEANDHVTTAEIDKAISEARLKAVQEQLDIVNKKLEAIDSEKKKK